MFYEIQSFISKFSHLSSLGYETSVNFSSSNRKVLVNFTANIGQIMPLQMQTFHHASSPTFQQQNRNEKSSVLRHIAEKKRFNENVWIGSDR